MPDDLDAKKRPGLEKIARAIGVEKPETMVEGGLRSAIRIRRRRLEIEEKLKEEDASGE